MKEDFTERLLDASLKQYSSVEVPEGFAGRLAQRGMGNRGWGIGRRWWWMMVPAAAALAIMLVMFAGRPSVENPQPLVAVLPHPQSSIPHPPASPRARRAAKPRWRTLSALEIAQLDFPDSLLAPMASKEPTELAVPEIQIKPLAGAEEETVPKEPQL